MELLVSADTEPMRLDRFLAAELPAASRRRVRQYAEALEVNGRPARLSATVRAGDRITFPEVLAHPPDIEACPDLALPILHEDEALIAVDKPAGMSSVTLARGESATVAAFLVGRYPELRSVGRSSLEAGLVHRLDRDTSGVLVAARTSATYENLRRQFTARTVQKEYLALVVGDVVESGWIRTALAHDRRRPRLMQTQRSRSGPALAANGRAGGVRVRPAETSYRPQVRFGAVTLLRVRITTGVMHQIRAHLASIGHPVLGDTLYARRGGSQTRPELATPVAIARHALHACSVELRHPVHGTAVRIESPMPADLEEILRRCT